MDEPAFRTIFEASPDPMWIFDEDSHRFLEVNPAASNAYGYSRDEFLGMSLTDIRPEEDIPAFLASIRPEGEAGERRWTHKRKDGGELVVTVFSTPTQYQGRAARAVLIRDITQQVRDRQELASANRTLSAILASSPACILSLDPEGRIETWNPAAERLIGKDLGDLRTKLAWQVLGIEEEIFDDTLRQVFDGKNVEGIEVALDQRGGERHLLLSAAPIFAPDGSPSGAMAVLLDISENVRSRLDLEAWSELLERRVSERTAELVAANDELEGFCASVSHDLRSPLRAIDGFSRAIIEDYGEALDEQGRDFLNRVRAAAWRMSDLIDDLLGLTRLTRTTLRKSLVDLSQISNDIVGELRFKNEFRPFDFQCADSVVVYGDHQLLKMLLSALIENAWKFTGPVENPRAEFRVETDGQETVYALEDNGVGFDMVYVAKLFRPFERLHRTAEFPGNGIGLATAHRIVAKHGGRIWAESAPGKGTTIKFTLDGMGMDQT